MGGELYVYREDFFIVDDYYIEERIVWMAD